MNESIVNEFMKFYYSNLNTHNEKNDMSKHLIPHLKQHSVFVRDSKQLKGERQIVESLFNTCYEFVPQQIDIVLNGERRANVVVSGQVSESLMKTSKYFTEYFHFAYGNDKQYWIHTSIFQIQK